MSGRHRRGTGGRRGSGSVFVGATGTAVLACGVVLYVVSALGNASGVPDPPTRSASTTSSTETTRASPGSPGMVHASGPLPGRALNRRPRATQAAEPTGPPPTSRRPRTTKPAKTKQPTKRVHQRTPQVTRSGNCYIVKSQGRVYRYCPRR